MFLSGLKPEFTVAVDIPSGICSETGRILGAAVEADLTVTFGYEKVGTAIYPGKGYCGRVEVKDRLVVFRCVHEVFLPMGVYEIPSMTRQNPTTRAPKNPVTIRMTR